MKPSQPFFYSIRNNLLSLLAFVALWALAALFFPVYIIPPPTLVLTRVPLYLQQGVFSQLWITLMRVAIGFSAAFVIGTGVGIWAATNQKAAHLNTIMVMFQVIPGTILGIIFLLVLGIGNRVPIVLVAVLTLPLVAVNTTHSLARRRIQMEQYLLSIGGGRSDLVRHVFLPALIPTLQSNLTIGFGLSLKVVILGEFIGSQSGIGYLLNLSRIYFRMDEVFFHLFIVVALMSCFQSIQNFLFSVLGRKYFYPD